MKRKKEWIQKIIAWILLVVMGINCFGSSVPAGSVYATDYEKASEEAENEIRAAEEAAKKKAEEEQEMTDEETVKTEGSQDNAETTENTDVINHNSEEDSEESLDSKMEAADETQLYESMTVASDTTLTEDLEVGDLTVNSKLHLNGHKLTVHGNVELNSSLYIEEGYLVIKGDFKDTYYAEISMDSLNDCVEIEGDYVYAANYRYARTVKKGTIKIGGNIYGSDGNCCNKSIVFGEDCKVILCGDSEQNIDILTNSQLQIQNLVIDNTSEEGVLSEHILSSSEITDENGKLHYKAEGTFGETLTEDKVVDGDYCLLGGTLDLAGYSLTVKGNLLHAGGTILVNGGELVVVGDYKKQLCYTENGTSVTDYSAGHLIMQNEQDYVLIHGDYFDSRVTSSEGELTAGVLELKGSMLADDDLTHPLFYA